MSFIKLQPTDFVVSADSITAPCWTGNQTYLEYFYTSSGTGGFPATSSAPQFYLDVFNTQSFVPGAEVQFSIAYGHISGSGSTYFNALVPYITPSRVNYGQYRTLVFGDENTPFSFGLGGSTTTNCGVANGNVASVEDIFVLNIERNRYKQHLLPGSLNLKLYTTGSDVLQLTDNSANLTTTTYLDCGRAYDIVSGSYGSVTTASPLNGAQVGYTASGSYGLFLPDVGLIILNPRALALPYSSGGISLGTSTAANTDAGNPYKLLNAMTSPSELTGYFQLNSEESIASDYLFIRVPNQEFNYTVNPSIISGSGDFIYSTFVNNPQTYFTTVGLYNDNNELLAVAKASTPLVKDFTKEALLRVKLDW